jgi:phosphoglycerol transferase MdoB-like AlkP superfamily enzyme
MHTHPTANLCCPTPAWPRYLRHAGTLPFFVLALSSWSHGQWQAISQDALLAYAALILTGIGLMHLLVTLFAKRRSLRRHLSLGWSVLPALAGWLALLLPSLLSAAVLLAGFWLHYLKDRAISGNAILPSWYLPTRFSLTAAASIALLLGAAAMVLSGLSASSLPIIEAIPHS